MDVGRLLLVGCGKMGGAMLAGWLEQGVAPAEVTVVEPHAASADAARGVGVAVVADAGELPDGLGPDVVILAVKPQNMDEVAPAYAGYLGANASTGAVALSIAAGKTIADFERYFGAQAAIVRSMPNTPAAVGRGMLVACPNGNVDAAMRGRCDQLLAAVGEVAWIDDETLMDAVTAVSGSGPAYVFLLIECLEEAGRAAGLPADLARTLALATVAGSGELARQAAEEPATLRRNVTSPGGTTAAALEVLMADDAMQRLLTEAVAAATRRSRELAG